MRSESWIQATGPNNGHQFGIIQRVAIDQRLQRHTLEESPLIYLKGAAPSLGCCSLYMTNQKL